MKSVIILFVAVMIAGTAQFSLAEDCLPDKTFQARKDFGGVRSCGERGRLVSEARAACDGASRTKFGNTARITMLEDPPQFTSDSNQRNQVCADRKAGICVSFKDECSGWVDATCKVRVCY